MFSWTSCLPPGSELDPEVDELGSLGFTGCLSSVLFNTVSPLKSALLRPEASSVTIRGPLTWSVCGSTAANLSAAETTHHLSGQTGELGIQFAAKAARFQLLSYFNIELLFFFKCNFLHLTSIFLLSILDIWTFFLYVFALQVGLDQKEQAKLQ